MSVDSSRCWRGMWMVLVMGLLLECAAPSIENAPVTESKAPTTKSCIMRTISRNSVQIKRLYERWLLDDPGLVSGIKVQFTIRTDGTCDSVSITYGSLGREERDSTVVAKIKRWSFAECPPQSPLKIEQPFEFKR